MHCLWGSLLFICLLFPPALAASPWQEERDAEDHSQFESIDKITSGIFEATRQQALERVEKLKVASVPHLSGLADDLRHSEIYLESENAPVDPFPAGEEISPDGRFVYVHTLPQPGAPTRFFPAALLLSEEKLVELHIHQALHRTLPESIRQNEELVQQMTVSIIEPTATTKSIQIAILAAMAKPVPSVRAENGNTPQGFPSPSSTENSIRMKPEEDAAVLPGADRDSFVRYDFRLIQQASSATTTAPSLHRLETELHPFDQDFRPITLGLGVSYVDLGRGPELGPVHLAARFLLASWQEFKFNFWAAYSSYQYTRPELTTILQARDATSLGLSLRSEGPMFYGESSLSVTATGSRDFIENGVSYEEKYLPVYDASLSLGGRWKFLSLGLRGDLLWSDGRSLTTTDARTLPQRWTLLRAGPEIAFQTQRIELRLYHQQLLDRDRDINLDEASDLVGQGAGEGFFGSSLTLRF